MDEKDENKDQIIKYQQNDNDKEQFENYEEGLTMIPKGSPSETLKNTISTNTSHSKLSKKGKEKARNKRKNDDNKKIEFNNEQKRALERDEIKKNLKVIKIKKNKRNKTKKKFKKLDSKYKGISFEGQSKRWQRWKIGIDC